MAADVSLKRRSFLAAAALVGCGGQVEESDLEQIGTPSWHMWGNKATTELVFQSLLFPTPNVTTTQLTNVQYKRPETWRFFMAARLLDINPVPAPGLDLITVDFNLEFGVGLGTVSLSSFVHFAMEPATDVGKLFWTGVGVGPARFSGDTTPNLIDRLPAQTIQVNAVTALNGAALATAHVEVSSFWAPNTHVRPEWFLQRFQGEQNGR